MGGYNGDMSVLRLTRTQVREVDVQAVKRFGISSLVLMENAGRNAASIINHHYASVGMTAGECHRCATIVCGVGNNGGDGFVIARHLHNFGWEVRMLIAGDRSRLTPDAQANFRIIQAMDLPQLVSEEFDRQRDYLRAGKEDAVMVDALLGTGFHGSVRTPMAELIESMNGTTSGGIVAIDVPSGLDCDTGLPSNATIKASLTVTLVAQKIGFAAKGAGDYLGKVHVADIGVPRMLIQAIASQDARAR